jgi:hypothetical protein
MLEIDLYRTAAEMIKIHGEDANLHAAMKSDQLLDAGDTVGAKVWRDIVKRIEILQLQKTDRITQH